MSKEILELIQQLKMEELEVKLALQCAPLIAGLKISNLLNILKTEVYKLKPFIESLTLCAYPLYQTDEKVTLLLFNKGQLENFMASPAILQLLSRRGYTNLTLGHILSRLSQRYSEYMEKRGEFPHEMGVLLGYPIEDVIGFIENNGKNFLYLGYWKVYDNVPEKIRLFASYEKAKEEILRQISYGRTIEEIAKTI